MSRVAIQILWSDSAQHMARGVEPREWSKPRISTSIAIGVQNVHQLYPGCACIRQAHADVAEGVVQAGGVGFNVAVLEIMTLPDNKRGVGLVSGRERGQVLLEPVEIEHCIRRDGRGPSRENHLALRRIGGGRIEGCDSIAK